MVNTTLFHGDCLEVMDGIEDESVDLVFADPPYNLSKEGQGMIRKVRPNSPIAEHKGDWDEMSPEAFEALIKGFLARSWRVLKPGGTILVCCSHHEEDNIKKWIKERFEMQNRLIWHKPNPSPLVVKTRLVWSYESIFVARKSKGNTVNWGLYPYTEMHDVWSVPICQGKERLKGPNGKSLHPTQKPLRLVEKAIRIFSNEGDVVLDPFMGVGTTPYAAKKNKRHSIGIDMNRIYVDAAAERIGELEDVV